MGVIAEKLADIYLIKANEVFAAQALAVGKDLGFEKVMDRVNVNGGVVALGHPIGSSGCRILATLLHEMQKRGSKQGLAALCSNGGMGYVVIIFLLFSLMEGARKVWLQ